MNLLAFLGIWKDIIVQNANLGEKNEVRTIVNEVQFKEST